MLRRLHRSRAGMLIFCYMQNACRRTQDACGGARRKRAPPLLLVFFD